MTAGLLKLLRQKFEQLTWEEAMVLFPKLNLEFVVEAGISTDAFFGLNDNDKLLLVDPYYGMIRAWMYDHKMRKWLYCSTSKLGIQERYESLIT